MSLIEHQASTPATQGEHKPARVQRLSKRLTDAIRLLETGECKTVKAASERVGMHYGHLCEALKKPQAQAFIARKRSENIAMGSLQASWRLPQLVFAESEHVAAKVAERLLEQSGDLRQASSGVTVNLNNHLAVGYVVDLAPKPMRTVNSTLTQDQAQDVDNTR